MDEGIQASSRTRERYLNVAGYLFAPLSASSLDALRNQVRELTRRCDLRGTVTLTLQGTNCGVSGTPEKVRIFLAEFPKLLGVDSIPFKESYSDSVPFDRMLVKVKPRLLPVELEWDEAISSATQLPARMLREWLDEGREVVLVDTRNDYEHWLGTFDGAVPLPITTFRNFEEEARARLPEWKDKTIVTFCTGGIRCEMAVPLMVKKLGYERVFQLQGGILQYFEEVGADHWKGDCFVFDKRVSVDPNRHPSSRGYCREIHGQDDEIENCRYCAFANGYRKHVLSGEG